MRWRKAGFTLIELLTIMAIIGVLVGLTLPAVQSMREASQRVVCQNNLRQVGVALSNYQSTFRHFPAGRDGCDDVGQQLGLSACASAVTPEQKNGASAFVAILAELEQNQLAQDLSPDDGGLWNRDVDDLDWWMNDQRKRDGILVELPVLWCPSESSARTSNVYQPVNAATSTYAFCNGSRGPDNEMSVTKYMNDGPFVYSIPRRAQEISDGLSNTFFVGEVVRPDIWESSNVWTYAIANADCLRTTTNPLNTLPGDGIVLERRNGAFGSAHPAGAFFMFGDGGVRFISDSIDLDTYRAFSTIGSREVVQP